MFDEIIPHLNKIPEALETLKEINKQLKRIADSLENGVRLQK